MKRCILYAALLLIGFTLCADPLAKVYQVDDPLMDRVEQLAIEAGVAPPSSAGPLSGYELYRTMEMIRPSTLSFSSKLIYEETIGQLLDDFDEYDSGYPANGRITISPEGYMNTAGVTYRDWFYSTEKRNVFATAEGEAALGDNFYGIFVYQMEKRFDMMFSESEPTLDRFNNNFAYGDDFKEVNSENSFPHTAFMGLSTSNTAFVAGRDAISWGRGNSGNLFIDDHASYHDFMQFSAYSGALRFSSLAVVLNRLQEDVYDDDTTTIKPATMETWEEKRIYQSEWADLFNGFPKRLFRGNRLEISLPNAMKLALTEGTLFYSDQLDLRMFSPLMYLHNYLNFMEANHFFQVEFEALVSSGWYLYSQLFLDQFQTGAEQDNTQELPPNAYAALLGVQWSRPVQENRTLSGYLEMVYTSPAVYLRNGDNANTNLDLVQMNSTRSGIGGISFIGYKYGPDSLVASMHLSYEAYKQFSVFGDLEFGVQGERGLYIDGKMQEVPTSADDLNPLTPSGDTPEFFLFTGIGGAYRFSEAGLSLYTQINTANRWNNRNIPDDNLFDVQFVLGANYTVKVF